MYKILSKVPYAFLGIFLGFAFSAIAATQFTAGTLLQPGDVTTTHILNNTILNTDINTLAAIVYSKLDLTNGVVNADVSSTAAISALKIAGGTPAGLVVLTNGTQLATSTNFSYATSTNKLTITGQLSVSASTTFRGVEYNWPTAQSASSTALMSDGAGKLIWDTPPVSASSPSFFIGTSTTYTAYSTPAGATQLYIKMCGGGGGGGNYATTNGGTGGQTQFGTGTASTTTNGGGGGINGGSTKAGGLGGTGGATAIGTGLFRVIGSGGNSGGANTSAGGSGGSSPFGGGAGSTGTVAGPVSIAADPYSCSGGGGTIYSGSTTGGGGGAGEYTEFTITTPSATYYYIAGAAGSGGGGAGGTGLVWIQAVYH